ncbi:MAG: hypothetical protein LLG14_12000 [Nocardiaceae bacterium]|nr:hypothetical protein [Nocardiaceae bacterium]
MKTILRSTGGAVLAACAVVVTVQPAAAKPAPEIEFTYNVAFRRHYQFPNNDAVGYGRTICDAVQRGDAYGVVVTDIRNEITPNDEESVNYLISNAGRYPVSGADLAATPISGRISGASVTLDGATTSITRSVAASRLLANVRIAV